MKKRFIYLLIVVLSFISFVCTGYPKVIDSQEYILYVPSGMDLDKKYPLVVALSPVGSAQSMIAVWKGIAEKYKWIVFASKEFRNGISMSVLEPKVISSLEKVFLQFPIDKSKIIVTGFSGGGMGSHMFSYDYPDLVRAIVVNTAMMHGYYIKDNYPKGKLAVFLASPADFRYNEMKRDRKFLEGLDWKTKWIEFQGGHAIAPEAVYQEAAQWLSQQLK